MRFNEAWLREWVNPDINTEQLAHQLTMAGLEVDAVEPAAVEFSGVVIAEVIATRPHPEADKLTLCEVNAGDGVYPVVCGAPNVRPGLRVAFAKIGAQLPGDLKIKKAKLRGQESQGMLCGASELGLEDVIDGLLELPADAPVGEDFRHWLKLDDQCIEIGLTPNRADCLSIRGIAREVSVLTGAAFCAPEIIPVPVSSIRTFPVKVSEPSACPRYLGRVIEGVNSKAQSPLWLREKLRRAGLRSIDALVDVTNYVLLELGQPLHAFDLAKLDGGIDVRPAAAGESLVLLDGQTLKLKQGDLLIADNSGPLALAGVMGGEASAVSAETTSIFLECAFFAPLALAGKARVHGLHTDSSHRFERGVDPRLQEQAIERATQLIIQIAGGHAGAVVHVESEAYMPAQNEVLLRAEKLESLLGMAMSGERIEDILGRLGMEVTGHESGKRWTALAPSWRFDIEREEDLIEELARVYGYSQLPSHLPSVRAEPRVSESQLPVRRLADALQDRGYQEVISYSFVDPLTQQAVSPGVTPLALSNPISSELSVMRSSLWAGLLTTARYNLNRQAERLRLFESGLRFVPGDQGLRQEPVIAGLLYGPALPQHWDGKPRKVDYFDLKGDVEALLGLTGDAGWQFESGECDGLHPGQTARLSRAGMTVGWLGKIHPALAARLDVSQDIYLFELELAGILPALLPRFAEISEFPAVRRDLAFVLPGSVPAAEVMAAVREVCGETLRDLRLFDVYHGQSIGEGNVSLALGLTFQDRSRTLGESDISSLTEAVVSLLKQEFNAHLRD
ncbi:MAG: phenylalanine--tRNA ligase subunit beta [Alcanivoracaceae bacterium]|jgi:phenylalanyl-tRNA synthetase beta chain|nr:phenylalanine--tRNA ligase subunit beta [Alcanivoracaceae bacterium]